MFKYLLYIKGPIYTTGKQKSKKQGIGHLEFITVSFVLLAQWLCHLFEGFLAQTCCMNSYF